VSGQIKELAANLKGCQTEEMAGRFWRQLSQGGEQAQQTALQYVSSFNEGMHIGVLPEHFAGQLLEAAACRSYQDVSRCGIPGLPPTDTCLQLHSIE
jgi:hypothetical protein